MLGFGEMIRLINRVVDKDGKRIPWEVRIGGEVVKMTHTLDLPVGMARIAVHQSMYMVDPVTGSALYRLGAVDSQTEEPVWGLPCDDLSEETVTRTELYGRELDAASGKVETRRIHNPVRRHDPVNQDSPRPNEDGAGPGHFGGALPKV